MTRHKGWAALLTLILMIPANPASAGDPYAADPLRLVPFVDTAQRVYTSGTDLWEVWVCNIPGWTPVTSVSSAVAGLDTNLGPYFNWLSNGRYTVDFIVGGTVSSGDIIPPTLTSPEQLSAPGCESAVAAASNSGAEGALIVLNAAFDGGYGTWGAVCPEAPFTGCPTTYPANSRRAVVGGAAVTTVLPLAGPQWITVAHEIGHGLNWTHSYSGLTIEPASGHLSLYDNPMDVMSGGAVFGAPIGTIAYNRYAAGWIDPAAVVVHGGGVALYQVSGSIGGQTEMVVLPADQEGHFFALGARRRVGYDTGLLESGVEVYEIEQRRELACVIPTEWPQTWPCFATLIRIKPVGASPGPTSTTHVLGIDDRVRAGRFDVSVVSADTSSFTVRVSEVASGRFVDDDGNPHEPDIEQIAARGVTLGCNPPQGDRYCPANNVSRGEMAAFLIRALGETPLTTHRGYFPDVPAGQWYTPYVERLFEIGITTGNADGTYQPGATVSRAEMAAFLVRAFDPGGSVPDAGTFTDIENGVWYQPAAERLLDLGISQGCAVNPLRYCPANPVRRDEMASFLIRSLALGG